MPDLATRREKEQRLAAAMLLLFGDEYEQLHAARSLVAALQGREAERGLTVFAEELPGLFDTDEFVKRAAPEIADPLASAFKEAGQNMLDAHGITRPIDKAADSWARRYSKDLAKELAKTTKDRLADLEPSSPSFDEDLATVFSEARAETIGITEVTRAITAGEGRAVKLIKSVTGRVLLATWFTEEDERVCPICEPLHETTPRVWQRLYPFGPPAHPRCRCWLEYQ